MYIRQITRKNKDGSKVTYVQLAHNEWDNKRKLCTAKVIHNFGRLEELDVDQLHRLVKSIKRFLPPEDVLELEVQEKHANRSFKWLSRRSYGGIFLLSALWQQLNFRDLLQKRIKGREYTTDIVQAIFAMIANRCLAPASKLAVSEWIEKDVYIPNLPSLGVQVLYRAMDFLLEHQDELEQEIYWAVADLLNLEVDLLFFDTTSTYFETEEESDLKRFGYSKDKRSDLPQVVIGLAVTRSGIPVKHWVFPGNTSDMDTIAKVKKDLGVWKLNRCIMVHDRGMSSESNLAILQQGGGHYIVGRKMRSGEAEVEQALGQKGRYAEIEPDLFAKEAVIGSGEKRKRFIIAKNSKEEERDKNNREKLIATLQQKIDQLNGRKAPLHNKAVCELKAHKIFGKYVKELADGRLKIVQSRLDQESHYDGKYLIETSDDTLSLRDIVLGYKQLYDIERAFRTLKTELDLQPNYHSRDNRIRCHIFLCFIALTMVRIIENKAGKTWNTIRKEMDRWHYGEFIIESKKIGQFSELTDQHRNILNSLNIKEPDYSIGIQKA
jgi:transposase